jgi:uncharacterized protein YjgD (DUF1641 family)
MGIQDLIDNVLKAARVATKIIPGTADDAIVGVASKLNDIIGDLTSSAPDNRTQEEMQKTRKELAAAVSAKAERTADRFDG